VAERLVERSMGWRATAYRVEIGGGVTDLLDLRSGVEHPGLQLQEPAKMKKTFSGRPVMGRRRMDTVSPALVRL
jgi:hypothetical protein